MLTGNEIEYLIYNTVDIVPLGEDSVFLGVFSLVDNEEILNVLLTKVTSYYDKLIATLPLSTPQLIALQMQRCFTWHEYKALHTASEKDFKRYVIFKTLLITTQAERLLFITNPNCDDSYQSFLVLLENWSEIHNPFIHSLIYGFHN